MVETPEQIEWRIRDERGRLGQNLNELQGRVRDAADWRTYVNRNPLAVMGAAFGAGLLMAQVAARRREPIRDARSVYAPIQGGETWRNLRAALMGVTGAGVRHFLNDVIPGFQEHYDRARYGRMSPS